MKPILREACPGPFKFDFSINNSLIIIIKIDYLNENLALRVYFFSIIRQPNSDTAGECLTHS